LTVSTSRLRCSAISPRKSTSWTSSAQREARRCERGAAGADSSATPSRSQARIDLPVATASRRSIQWIKDSVKRPADGRGSTPSASAGRS
jgi:hypothetical protein